MRFVSNSTTGASPACAPRASTQLRPRSAQRPQASCSCRASTCGSADAGHGPSSAVSFGRRGLLLGGLLLTSAPQVAEATPLAPLGGTKRVGEKRIGIDIEEVRAILERDLKEGQYFVTGNLSPEIFDDNCRFKDPTNDIAGLSRYMKALTILFDATCSSVVLKDIEVTSPSTIEANWTLGGYLKFPWNPEVSRFDGHTVYTLNSDGLIIVQDQTWSKSAAKALQESFTQSFGPRKCSTI